MGVFYFICLFGIFLSGGIEMIGLNPIRIRRFSFFLKTSGNRVFGAIAVAPGCDFSKPESFCNVPDLVIEQLILPETV